jgi:hypothetical protein
LFAWANPEMRRYGVGAAAAQQAGETEPLTASAFDLGGGDGFLLDFRRGDGVLLGCFEPTVFLPRWLAA